MCLVKLWGKWWDMPKKAKALPAVAIGRIQAPGLHAVGGVAGLHLRVTPSGARNWVLRVRVGSKRRDIGLGGFPDVPLAMARDRARVARSRIRDGVDVVAERRAARQALIASQAKRITFAEAARAKWSAIVPQFRNAKHRKDWYSSLERYALPTLGALDVADIDTPHVLAVLQPIWATRTETATRVRQRIEAVLSWAIATKHLSGPNPARWKGNLSEALPEPGKIAPERHQRALDWHGVPAFMARLRKRKGAAARALEFSILTAARSGEARGCEWDEIDLEARTWTVPAARMKSGRAHVVPLSDAAIVLVRAQPRLLGSRFVFAAPRFGGKLSDVAMLMVCRRANIDATPHGFRSSFKDWARNCTRYPDEASELALAHVNDDKTRAAYARDGLLPMRAKLMADWARYCAEGLPESASVTPINEARA